MQNEKEQEMMSPANPTDATPSSQRDLVTSLEILDTEFSSRPIGEYPFSYPWFALLISLISPSSTCTVSWLSSCAFCCLFFSEVVQPTWGLKWARQTVHSLLSGTINSLLFSVVTWENRWLVNERKIQNQEFSDEQSAQKPQHQINWGPMLWRLRPFIFIRHSIRVIPAICHPSVFPDVIFDLTLYWMFLYICVCI